MGRPRVYHLPDSSPITTPEDTYRCLIIDKSMKTKTGCNYYYCLNVYQVQKNRWKMIQKKHFNKNLYELSFVEDFRNKINLTPPGQSYPSLPY